MVEDIADRLRELADEIESGDEVANDLPEFCGYQMVKCANVNAHGGEVYQDTDGEVWIHTENGRDTLCLGEFADEFIQAISELDDD